MRALHVAGLMLFLVLPSAGCAVGAVTLTEPFDKTYPLRSGGSFAFKNDNGAVTVEAWDQAQVQVSAVKEVRAESDDDARQAMTHLTIEVSQSANGWRVETRMPTHDEGFWGWLSGHHVQTKVDYHIKVPRHLDLQAESMNGGVNVTGTQGSATVETTNGGIQVRGMQGKLSAETTNGSIVLAEVAGSVKAETTNGSVKAQLTRVEGDLSFESTNGSVVVHLPGDVRATLDASTTNGSVHSAFEVAGGRNSRRHLTGDINGGGGKLLLSTSNGSVRIENGGAL
jgi:uncharacterized protein involved in outer membrane biogenesis